MVPCLLRPLLLAVSFTAVEDHLLTSSLHTQDWHGEAIDSKRPVIRFDCDPNVPCHGITVDNVNLWAENGDEVVWSCQHAYGSGACLRQAGSAKNRLKYEVAAIVTEKPYVLHW